MNQAWNIDIWFIVTEATKDRISDELSESNFRIMPKEKLSENEIEVNRSVVFIVNFEHIYC